MSLPPDLLAITQADIERLILDKAQEGPHVDFKRDLPSQWDQSAKHELLADVTAFANSAGGDIIYGLDELDAIASSLAPQQLDGVDETLRRLQDFLLNLAEPRLPGVQIRAIEVADQFTNGHVVVVRVPQSWAAPHRVKTNQHVYVRDGLRKRPLDVPELRGLFLRSETQAQRIRDFRTERLSKVISGETPVRMENGPKLVIHVIPTQAALGLVQVDPLPYVRRQSNVPVLGHTHAPTVRLNFDGACGSVAGDGDRNSTYTQIFRNGFVEAVWTLPVHPTVGGSILSGQSYEELTNAFLGSARAGLDRQGLQWEMTVFLSLLDADKVAFLVPSPFGMGHGTRKFDRSTMLFPDVLLPAEVLPGRGMRTIYNMMYQAAGFEGSPNYTADGEWKAPK